MSSPWVLEAGAVRKQGRLMRRDGVAFMETLKTVPLMLGALYRLLFLTIFSKPSIGIIPVLSPRTNTPTGQLRVTASLIVKAQSL